jgi:hypothetical protein
MNQGLIPGVCQIKQGYRRDENISLGSTTKDDLVALSNVMGKR